MDFNVLIQDDVVYSSPNSTKLPPIPNFTSDLHIRSPADAMNLRWASNQFPQIAFAPVTPRFDGPLFNRLRDGFLIEPVGTKWQLATATQESWYRLERNLHAMSSTLISSHPFGFPLDFSYFPLPASYGYQRQHCSRAIASRCASQSRDAFVQLACMSSYAIALFSKRREDFREPIPAWVRFLHEKGVHPAWVDNFKASQFADFFHTERVGTMIHPGCKWLNHVPALVRANVPLWIFWGDGNPACYAKALSFHAIKSVCPSQEQISALRAKSEALALQLPQSPIPEPKSSPAAKAPIPSVQSRQKQGESWQQFFERLAVVHQRRKATETPLERQRRENRERQAGGCPGNRGPTVFEWVDVSGYLIRTKVERSILADTWEDYSTSQRRFNSFDNEWDLCTFFDPDGCPAWEVAADQEAAEEDEEGDPFQFLPAPVNVSWTSSAPNPDYHEDLPRAPAVPTTTQEMSMDGPCFEDVLFRRFGFIVPDDFARPANSPPINLTLVKKVFGHESNHINDVSAHDAIIEFYNVLLSSHSVPPLLCDLHLLGQSPLGPHSNVAVTLVQYRDPSFYFLDPKVQPSTPDAPYRIAVFDPVTALECCRRNSGTSRFDIARSLLERGTPFLTLAPIPRRTTLYPRPHCNSVLGWRRQDYNPDARDYFEYEELLRDFFRRPHARAALLRGGLIWRLAKEVLGDIADSWALMGPSEEVDTFGMRFRVDASKTEFADDALSEGELDFISGMYRIYTGQLIHASIVIFPDSFDRLWTSDPGLVLVAKVERLE